MPTAKFIHDGDAIDYRPGTDVASGDVIVQNDLIAAAKRDIPAHTLGALAVTGVFDVPKATGGGSGIGAGVKVYWDATAKQATETTTSNTYLGKTVAAAADGDATVRVRLEQ